jgi:hypothetical protein
MAPTDGSERVAEIEFLLVEVNLVDFFRISRVEGDIVALVVEELAPPPVTIEVDGVYEGMGLSAIYVIVRG